MGARSGVQQSMYRRVMREDGYRCALCGIQGREVRRKWSRARNAYWTYPTKIEGVVLSIDHINPRSRGGGHERSNLRILCTTCNGLRQAPNESPPTERIEEHW